VPDAQAESSKSGTPALLWTDRDGHCTYASPGWDELTGSSPQQGLGEGWLEFIHGEDREGVRAEWLACVQRAAGYTGRFRLCGKDRQVRLVHLNFAPMHSRAGDITGYLGIVEESGQRQKREADLLQSQKMEAVGRLASGLAHDFANLLTLISGYSEALVSRVDENDPLRPELEEIRRASHRGFGLTAQLLAFSRRHEVEPQAIDVNVLVKEMQSMLCRVIGEDIELETRLEPGLGKVKADPGQMEQVIMNLTLNARDALPRGGRILIGTGNVEVSDVNPARVALAPGSYVMLEIYDSGSGIDAETMRHLFEPFFTTKEKGKGTGLGLSTVYSIVRQSGGAVWADSLPGKGATFTVYLPRVEGSISPAIQPVKTREDTRGTETILLVEDEEGVRRLLHHLLSKRGYHVIEASNGPEALAIVRDLPAPVDLLLTDIVMPRMSGRELAERMCEARPQLKVIFMSGYTNEVLVRTGVLSPGSAFLQKPLRAGVLESKLREVLDGRRAATCAPR
jgi:two-component system cell cycle sensor histidine kinase/response regulator CckA